MSQDQATQKLVTRARFNSAAADYDGGGPGCFAHFGRRLAAVADLLPGQRVLDVASGRGAVLFPAAELIGETGEIAAIDLAEDMAQAANQEAVRRCIRARVQVMDAENLDFPDSAFDRVLCGFGILHFHDQQRALGEFRRVLKTGGRVCVSAWRIPQTSELVAVLQAMGLWNIATPGWAEPEVLNGLLTQAGFANVKVQTDSFTFRYADIGQYWQQARTTGVRRVLDTLDPVATERVRAALAQRVSPHQRPDGIYLTASALLAVAD